MKIPIPSGDQARSFVKFLADTHNWYKNLSLLEGGEFVIFLARDAGERCCLRSRRGSGSSVESYRKNFGYLDYMYRRKGVGDFCRDDFDRISPAEEPLVDGGPNAEAKRFLLYPYVSGEFYWSFHDDDVDRIRRGASHPDAALILEARDSHRRMEECWDRIFDSHHDRILAVEDEEAAAVTHPDPVVRGYFMLEDAACRKENELRERERAKILLAATALSRAS